MSRLAIALLAAQIFGSGATPMIAQDSSYDNNALRAESRRGDLQIVRGKEGIVVARAGVFRAPQVANLVRGSDNAVAEAKIFEHNFQPGQSFLALGIVTMGAALGVSRIDGVNTWISTGLTVASVALITYGGTKLESAYRALSKAIWWYNRDLSR